MPATAPDDRNGKQLIARAATVLRALEHQRAGLSLGDIARATGLPRTTVHRIVLALEAQQLVMNAPGGVRLGPAIVRMAASAQTDLVALARPGVEALGRHTRETVDVTVLRDRQAVLIDQFQSDRELRAAAAVGTAFPLHCTAPGKALLAQLDEADVDDLLGAGMPAHTPATLTEPLLLQRQLAGLREGGLALDREEHAQGVCGIGIALRTGLPEHYAISLAVPRLRYDESAERLHTALLQCKAEIESQLNRAE